MRAVLIVLAACSAPVYANNELLGNGIFIISSASEISSKLSPRDRQRVTPEGFIHDNYAAIKTEAARGNGEHLRTAGEMLIDDAESRGRFYESLKTHHQQVFQDDAHLGTQSLMAFADNFR